MMLFYSIVVDYFYSHC